jgi:CRISPR/Cas system-associated exonuclease Cas4 (RecB family)
MKLVTLNDLDQPEENYSPLIAQAQRLAELWTEFVKQDGEYHEYTVVDHGERQRSPGIHASEMSKCLRMVVYSIMATERRVQAGTVSANLKMRFRTGTALHALLQSDFRRMAAWYTKLYSAQGYALSFEPEVSVKSRDAAVAWSLSSTCDGAFTFWRWTGGEWEAYLRVGVEIKTSSDGEFQRRKAPEPDHLEQTTLYQACLDLPLMWVLYYNKNNSNFTTPYSPWLFKFDKALWQRELEMRFAKAHHHAELKVLPDRTESSNCGFCPFAWTCQPNILTKAKVNYYSPPTMSVGGMRSGGR